MAINIELKEAKLLFRSGSLSAAYIQRDALYGAYIILFDQHIDGIETRTVYRSQRNEEPKVFKSVDTALNAVKEIGFNSVTVCKLQG